MFCVCVLCSIAGFVKYGKENLVISCALRYFQRERERESGGERLITITFFKEKESGKESVRE